MNDAIKNPSSNRMMLKMMNIEAKNNGRMMNDLISLTYQGFHQ